MILFSFILSFCGFVALSLAMKRHYAQIRAEGNSLLVTQKIVSQVIGFACLISACGLCMKSEGVSLGLVYWAGILTAVALLQTLLLSYRPQWVVHIVLMALMTGAVTGWMS